MGKVAVRSGTMMMMILTKKISVAVKTTKTSKVSKGVKLC